MNVKCIFDLLCLPAPQKVACIRMWVSLTHCLFFFLVPGRKLLREACARRMKEMDQRGQDFLVENSCVASTLACLEQEQQAQNRSTCHRRFSEIDLVCAHGRTGKPSSIAGRTSGRHVNH